MASSRADDLALELLQVKSYISIGVDTLTEDIEEMSSMQESELAALRAEFKRGGQPLQAQRQSVPQLRYRVAGLEDELVDLTWRFAALDHTWDEERATLEVGRVATNSRTNDLALELL